MTGGFCQKIIKKKTSHRKVILQNLSVLFAAVSCMLLLTSKAHGQKKAVTPVKSAHNAYSDLLKSLDLYAPPPSAKKLLTIAELHQLVQAKGIALKVSRETLNAAKQNLKTENDKKIPVISLDLGHDQSWTKKRSDSDLTDTENDRKHVSGARSINSKGGFSLSGAPMQGVGYKLSFPQLTHVQNQPSTDTAEPPRPDTAAFNASVEVSLLKDNPLSVESLLNKKRNIALSSAREVFKSETIKKLHDAEASYYGLIQKYLQLAVQERSLKLAVALEGDVKEKIAAGESSALEATRAELQAAQAEADFMSAQIDYEAAIEDFRSSLAFDEADGQGVFPDPKAIDMSVDGLTIPANALPEIRKSNPEINVARFSKQVAGIELELARNSTMPSLALAMNYGNATVGNGWPATASDAMRPNDRTYSVGLTYSQIIFNNTSRNTMQQAAVSKQKAEFAADEVERSVVKEFNALTKKLEIGAKRYRIAKISREISEKKLASEYERFRVGESSVRAVIDSQTEVNGARISEIAARVEMILGFGKFRSLQGKLPEGLALNYGG